MEKPMIDLKPIPGLSFLAEENGKPCHKHMLNGREIPGCTSISGLFQDDGWKFAWPVKEMYLNLHARLQNRQIINGVHLLEAKSIWRRKRDKAADTGTIAHGYIEDYIKSGARVPPTQPAEVLNCFNEFIRWEGEFKPEWLGSEIQVGSAIWKFAGILDALAKIDGCITLVDFKTSSDIKDDYAIQLAGLCIGLDECGVTVDQRAILHLPKEGPFEYRIIDSDLTQDKAAFLAGLNFYNHKNIFMGRMKNDRQDYRRAA